VPAQKIDRRVDVLQIDARQRAVEELVAIEASGDTPGGDILLQVNAYVLGLALLMHEGL
jgi:hypothetical protein